MRLCDLALFHFVFLSLVASLLAFHPTPIKVPGVAGLPIFPTATITRETIYLSGMLGTLNNTSPPTLIEGGVGPETTQVLNNIKWSLEYIFGISSSEDIDVMSMLTSCRVYLKENSPEVYREMNEFYGKFFSSGKYPARMCLGGMFLNLGAAVEIECTAANLPARTSRFFPLSSEEDLVQ